MSYTAPQYVDTKEQAILALASTIKGEAVTGGDGDIERETIYDADTTFTYTAGGSYTASIASYEGALAVSSFAYGDSYVMQLDDVTVVGQGDESGFGSDNRAYSMDGATYYASFRGSLEDGLYIENYAGIDGPSTALETWCASPHHVTIKRTNILA